MGNPSGSDDKWAALDGLAKFTTLDKTQRWCMRKPRGRGVSVGRVGASMTVRGALPCGTRFCPNCGPKIQGVRRDEIRECVEAARGMGWTTLFLTLTLAHERGDSLDSLLDALFASWKGMTHGGFWNRVKRRHGLRHSVRVVECQQGGAHGWHPHLHVLLFLDTAAAADYSVEALEAAITAEWTRLVFAGGHRASAEAQRLVEPSEEHLDRMSGYFTKQMAGDLSWEMTSGSRKTTKGESRNPAQLLDAALAGDAESIQAWRELEAATKGRQLIGYTAHARRDLRLEPSLSLDEIKDLPEPHEPLVEVNGEDWQEHSSRFGFRSSLAEVVQDARTTPEALLWWLHDRGIRAEIAPDVGPRTPQPDRPGPAGAEWLALPAPDGSFS